MNLAKRTEIVGDSVHKEILLSVCQRRQQSRRNQSKALLRL